MQKIKSLYITYMGLTEPLLRSQAVNYLRLLSRRGISTHILSFEKKGFITMERIAGIKKELIEPAIRWSFLIYHKRFQIISKPYDMIIGMLIALLISIRDKIGVVHARGTISALIGILPVIFLRKKMIFDMRGLMAEEYLDAGLWKRSSLIYVFVNRLEHYFMKRADEVIILNSKMAGMMADKYKISTQNITIIPTCVDLGQFNLRPKNYKLASTYSMNEKFVLMYIGSIGTWYMLSEMIDFYKELNNGNDKAIFFILSQTERRVIDKHIEVRLKEKVLVDSVAPERVADFLNFANTGILFIKPCFSKMASCPTKFGEYLACGVPVVINMGIGDTADIVKENRIGVVVEHFTPAEYRKRINELKELLQEGETLAKRCRSVAERYFSLEEGAKKYRRVYSRIADS